MKISEIKEIKANDDLNHSTNKNCKEETNIKEKQNIDLLNQQKVSPFDEEIISLSPSNRYKLKNKAQSNEIGSLKGLLPSGKIGKFYDQICELNGNLQNLITKLENKIGNLLQTQEQEYLVAYKGEMIEIEKKLKHYQDLIDDKQHQEKQKEKILLLNNSLEWLRRESERLSQISNDQKIHISLI